MNYNHDYHAGNFADVFKHVILTFLLEKMCEKEKPFCVIDTHAGSGYYEFKRGHADKTKEYEGGVIKLMNIDSPLLASYQNIIRQYNTHSRDGLPVLHYPGSPLIATHFLRENDKLFANELHPGTFRRLCETMKPYRQVKCRQENGYQLLNAQCPPAQKRGVILIDPPYEKADELNTIVSTLKKIYPKFSHGIYAIWYPIKTRYPIKIFHNALRATDIPTIFIAELCLHGLNNPDRLNGCGMVIINPPWQFKEKVEQVISLLKKHLVG